MNYISTLAASIVLSSPAACAQSISRFLSRNFGDKATMARFGGSFVRTVIAMVVVASLHNGGVMAQNIAPTPAMDAGAGLELPISMAVISSSMMLSLLALLLQ
ncbi:PROTEIN putative-RELATED-RELATED [Salix viminalis]|uniref:PROTEIN putative-RELATED-RELATED n=2 Tax=Salix TaxID=40685 RepID=A0A9Q0V506_SALVM|nr:PROTEIN putative-RELATED-RELATED [Salix viminalis]